MCEKFFVSGCIAIQFLNLSLRYKVKKFISIEQTYIP